MRTILFKAKRLDNGEWVEGSLYQSKGLNNELVYIGNRSTYGEVAEPKGSGMIFGRFIEVDPETICQYTGLTDKNGNKIFEGDAVKCKFGNSFEIWIVKWVDHFEYNGYTTIGYLPFSKEDWHIMEVIGNIFDNPELLTK
jgi:uncharacterized phage protein (TIGR01671 family)